MSDPEQASERRLASPLLGQLSLWGEVTEGVLQNKGSINSLAPPLSGSGIKNSENMSSPRLDASGRAATPADHTGFAAITCEAHSQVVDSSRREEAAPRQSTTKSVFPPSSAFTCSPSLGLTLTHC
ncbi:unnamed protein product [Gulo gulo]|uniref:Uncharacterized protein n=1 Tax=Gulo gulo TaxID=48420 RepID=A0A9X9LJF4_GULGU|nr:unnamed protein product [Gulo gulo]